MEKIPILKRFQFLFHSLLIVFRRCFPFFHFGVIVFRFVMLNGVPGELKL